MNIKAGKGRTKIIETRRRRNIELHLLFVLTLDTRIPNACNIPLSVYDFRVHVQIAVEVVGPYYMSKPSLEALHLRKAEA